MMHSNVTAQPTKIALAFHKADKFELLFCQKLNRAGSHLAVKYFFKGISRLGDGVFWYCLLLALPVFDGMQGAATMLHIVVSALVCVLIYSQLKKRLVRQRPFISSDSILPHCAPLDLYSFPSGHTMNAVNFTILFGFYYPALLWLLAPFALLVAISRVILGMHYPTDVLVGALLGAVLATGSLFLVLSV